MIGERLPTEKIVEAIPALHESLQEDGWADAARAIMTTDTFPKAARRDIRIGETPVRIQGIAKGSGMVAPDMATMLGFVATDAALPNDVLQALLREGIDQSFNSITVDSDTSTSDMVLLFATGKAGNDTPANAADPALRDFRAALHSVLHELALMVVRDGEGATKLMTIRVTGATSNESARRIALSVGNSPSSKPRSPVRTRTGAASSWPSARRTNPPTAIPFPSPSAAHGSRASGPSSRAMTKHPSSHT